MSAGNGTHAEQADRATGRERDRWHGLWLTDEVKSEIGPQGLLSCECPADQAVSRLPGSAADETILVNITQKNL